MGQYQNCPVSTRSGSNLHESLVLDAVVHETTNGILLGHDVRESSHKGSDIIHGVIIRTTTSEGDGSSVVFQGDVLDGRGTGDCELHN